MIYALQEEKAAEPNLTSKKGMKAENGSCVALPSNEVETSPAAFDKEELCGTEIDHLGNFYELVFSSPFSSRDVM